MVGGIVFGHLGVEANANLGVFSSRNGTRVLMTKGCFCLWYAEIEALVF